MSKPMKKQELRDSVKNCRGYLRLIEQHLTKGDWDEVETWVGTVAGEFSEILDRLEQHRWDWENELI